MKTQMVILYMNDFVGCWVIDREGWEFNIHLNFEKIRQNLREKIGKIFGKVSRVSTTDNRNHYL